MSSHIVIDEGQDESKRQLLVDLDVVEKLLKTQVQMQKSMNDLNSKMDQIVKQVDLRLDQMNKQLDRLSSIFENVFEADNEIAINRKIRLKIPTQFHPVKSQSSTPKLENIFFPPYRSFFRSNVPVSNETQIQKNDGK